MPLRHSAATVQLPPGLTDAWTDVLASDDSEGAARWRVVMVAGSAPLDLQVQWSAGGASSFSALVSLSNAGQITVFAKHLRVQARNRATDEQRVSVGVADGQAAAENVFERQFTGTGAEERIEIPPFARSVQVESTGPPNAITVALYDGLNVIKTAWTADLHLAGAPLGPCSKVGVTVPAGVVYRVIFGLVV